ncbi:cell envelope integrity protein CreD [Parasulfuritortus cantonensis]|uniref:Cell envelope integrity protein CreD n=1 Tax=Parasulfuritortus cantonensis TaxID=2528202 RepID=A0A4R1B302_9PROT|nr:cell envelope integrity protein CreD [Parasulfuritortus cantonensis]TCJ12221.1 cell envelope integrity protein CreD [Parasulfuritortus cantonensis]
MNRPLVAKLLSLVLLALILSFALGQVEWKASERQATRDAAVRSIADQYAGDQQLVGPLLWLKCSEPATVTETDAKGETRSRRVVRDCSRLVRPTRLAGQGALEVSERYRGIYRARVYLASLKLAASVPAWQAKPGQTIKEAALVFGVSDPRGLKRIQVTDAAGRVLAARPGVPGGGLEFGFHVPLDAGRLASGLDLALELELAGSGGLDIVPVAGDNDLSLRSAWPHPSFTGRFLPEARTVDASGFSARWRVNDFASGGDRVLNETGPAGDGRAGAFTTRLGVSLVDPVDAYTQTDRAVRYGFLFILLTLGGFFLFELLRRRPVHPLQYLLVGFAVVLFFLLLLALSEHVAFAAAYLVAASACTLLIAAYGRSLVGGWRGAGVLAAGYGLLYLGLYQLLASEDYALLMGAWLIFGLLALTMWLTRRLDWNRAGLPASQD